MNLSGLPDNVRAMIEDPQAPTAPLPDFLLAFENDGDLWWRIGCGHHLNLFEEAVAYGDEIAEKVLQPLLHVQDLRGEGPPVDVALADVAPGAEGYEIVCRGCGRRAYLPYEPPPQAIPLCAECLRRGGVPEGLREDRA